MKICYLFKIIKIVNKIIELIRMEYCQEKKYENEVYQLYSKVLSFQKFLIFYLEKYDDENSYERLLTDFYSKNSKL